MIFGFPSFEPSSTGELVSGRQVTMIYTNSWNKKSPKNQTWSQEINSDVHFSTPIVTLGVAIELFRHQKIWTISFKLQFLRALFFSRLVAHESAPLRREVQ